MFNSSEKRLPLTMPFACTESNNEKNLLDGTPRCFYCAQLLFLRQGTLKARLNGEETTLQTGDVLVICPGMTFSLTGGGEEDQPNFALILMDPDQLADTPAYIPGMKSILTEARKHGMPLRLHDSEAGDIPFQIEACLLETERQEYGWDLAVCSRLYLICTGLIRFWRGKGMSMPAPRNAEEPILSVTAYINRHVQDGLKVEELAEGCGLSYPWFAKKFREIYGISCKEFIEQVRVARVEQYLRYTDWDLAEISRIAGYADCSHMIKNFKRLTDTTPGQYRSSHRK